MLLGLGPFRFTVPTFSVEEINRKTGQRVAHQNVIGAPPITHLLGPQPRTVSLSSTFFPLHLNRAGGPMLDALHEASERAVPMLLVSRAGRVYGLFILESVESGQTLFAPNGRAQIVTASLELASYVS